MRSVVSAQFERRLTIYFVQTTEPTLQIQISGPLLFVAGNNCLYSMSSHVPNRPDDIDVASVERFTMNVY